jgi:hypothetical protein
MEVTSFSDEPEELTWEEVEDSFDTWIDDIDPDIKEGPGATGYSYSQMLKAFKAGYKLMKYGTATWEDEDEEKEPNDEDSKFTEVMTNPDLETTIESLKQLLRLGGGGNFLSGLN